MLRDRDNRRRSGRTCPADSPRRVRPAVWGVRVGGMLAGRQARHGDGLKRRAPLGEGGRMNFPGQGENETPQAYLEKCRAQLACDAGWVAGKPAEAIWLLGNGALSADEWAVYACVYNRLKGWNGPCDDVARDMWRRTGVFVRNVWKSLMTLKEKGLLSVVVDDEGKTVSVSRGTF